jgi:hypothetical protein
MFTIRVLRNTLKEFSASGEVGALIAEVQDTQLRRIFNRARKLKSKKAIKRGAKLAKAAEEAAELAQRADTESKLPEALAKITSDTQLQTVGMSDIEIDIEIQRLLSKKQLETDPIKTQVIDAIISGLESGKTEGRSSPTATITDQAKEIVQTALNDTSQASRMIAQRLKEQPSNLRSLTIVLDAFRLLNYESETRVDIIRELVLMQLGPDALSKLSSAKKGSQAELILNWLTPDFRKDLQFAVAFAKDPVGHVTIDDLRNVKDSERPAAVTAAVRSVSPKSLRSLALTRDGRELLIEMTFQLWSRGHSKAYESVGDELANAVAPSRGFKGKAIQLPALPGISLGIRTSERKIIVSMDSLDIEQAVAAGFDRRYVLKLFISGVTIDPEDVIVIKEQANELGSVMPALKLLEMKARGDKTLLGLAALKLRESADEAKDIISTSALNLIRNQERKLEEHVNKARTYLFENVPEEYRLEALTALEIFADAGRLALSAEAHAIGSAVGITKGAIEFGTGAVETAALVSETASDIEKATEDGRVFEELKVKTDDVSNTVKVTMVVAPEQVGKAIQDINKKLAKAGIAEKALIVSEIEGRIAFEVATTVAGAKAPSVLGRLKGVKNLPSVGPTPSIRPLPDKPKVRAPSGPSGEELPVPQRIIDKDLQKEGRELSAANEPHRLPPEAPPAEVRKIAVGEEVGDVGQLKPAMEATQSPDLKVISGGVRVPEASIKGKSKPPAHSTTAPGVSKKTRSLSPPDRVTGSARGITRPVIERETKMEDLVGKRVSPLNELREEDRLRRKKTPKQLKTEREKKAIDAAARRESGEDIVDESFELINADLDERLMRLQKQRDELAAEIKPLLKPGVSRKDSPPELNAKRSQRDQIDKEIKKLKAKKREIAKKTLSGFSDQIEGFSNADDFIKFGGSRLEIDRAEAQRLFDKARFSDNVGHRTGAIGEITEMVRLLRDENVTKIKYVKSKRGPKRKLDEPERRSADLEVSRKGQNQPEEVELRTVGTEPDVDTIVSNVREKVTTRTGRRKQTQFSRPGTATLTLLQEVSDREVEKAMEIFNKRFGPDVVNPLKSKIDPNARKIVFRIPKESDGNGPSGFITIVYEQVGGIFKRTR